MNALLSTQPGGVWNSGAGGESGVEGALVLPHGPTDTSKLVGQGDGGFVVTDAAFELDGPALQRVERRLLSAE